VVPLPSAGSGNLLERLLSGGKPETAVTDEPLPVEQAFRPSVEVLNPFRIAVDWVIAPGYYLYRDSLKVTSIGGQAVTGPAVLPAGESHRDEHFGDTRIFRDSVRIEVPLTRPTPDAGPVKLRLDFQGCKEDSICYPPGAITLATELPAASVSDQPAPRSTPAEPVAEQDRLSQLILTGNIVWVLATFTGLGLLLAFTPCVLPMVPILSGIIAGQGKDVTTGRAFTLSLTYVLGMAFTYTLAGAAVAAAGGQLQAALQKPWIIIAVAGLFVALALAMFGVYELQMPAFIRNRVNATGTHQRTGSFIGTAIMGALSALVVTTCVAPPLVASLTVIASAGDVTRGALSLFAMSIGMGIPLLVVGTSAGRLLPKAGTWMNTIKGAFGFMMLGLAIWMLERLLPGPVTLALWGVLLFVTATFMGAFTSLGPDSGVAARLGKSFGLIAALYAIALLIGAMTGASDPLRPLALSSVAGSTAERSELEFRRVKTVAELQQALVRASQQGQPAMLDFYADWCVSCKEMERYTFTDPGVHQALSGVLLLQADVTANDDEDQALLQHFGIFGPPSIIFFGPDGQERAGYRVVGEMPAAEFAAHVKAALRGS
ncbi:MAG TPA: protein-disulfide reductase DsbD, partial [Chromatiales bacterium]|nr:protein-disulfide reductase DsbD [Chromatiales bacterium]